MIDIFMLSVIFFMAGLGFGSLVPSFVTYLIVVKLTTQNIVMADSINENTKAITKLMDTIATNFGE